MKIVVPMQLVPDLVEDLEVDNTGKALNEEDLKLKLNEFDDHALEEAIQLKESDGAEVVAMTLDGEGADKLLFTALAKGADKCLKITGAAASDSHQRAKVFANAISSEGYDLVLTGVQSVDDRDGQLGPILATYLDVPSVSVVSNVSISGSTVTLRKEYSGGYMAEYDVETPAVLGIQAARQTPRYAPVSKIKQIQETMSIDNTEAGDSGSGSGSEITKMAPPAKGEGAKMLDSVDELIEVLKNAGAL
ncbi:MAG: electron transfer flavoprotein subunit beta/FixA family protein [Candidatus Marinimicrobia bacterium]|nr:electron transfer flavoprotein subunit beta/FixA family protein [Candidatus Neomarinimicrobiota bacterium]